MGADAAPSPDPKGRHMARIAIVYHSSTGNTAALARAIAEGAESGRRADPAPAPA